MMRQVVVLTMVLAGCADPPPPPPKVAKPEGPLVPLDRVCQEALPLREHTVGALARLVRTIAPKAAFETRACDAGTQWPIAFAESEQGRPPVGVTLLRMEGDVLLTFDPANPDAPTVKRCAELEAKIDERHRVRGVALWISDDETAFEPERLEASRAELAWIELLSRTPGDCVLGKKEEAGKAGEVELRDRIRDCTVPNFVTLVSPKCAMVKAPPEGEQPDARELERSLAKTHRYTFTGRESVRDDALALEGLERCAYEPPPATRDVCFAVYTEKGQRWYGRGDVTRTGVSGEKNYVDSYLTFQLLKRLEAERKGTKRPQPAPKRKK
jgi:hypothetical protein